MAHNDAAISSIIFDEKQYIRTANGVVIVHYSPEMLNLFHLRQQTDIKKLGYAMLSTENVKK